MVLLVLEQVCLALAAVEAARAVIGPAAVVLPAVGDEVGALAEGFPTHRAHVRLLTCRT